MQPGPGPWWGQVVAEQMLLTGFLRLSPVQATGCAPSQAVTLSPGPGRSLARVGAAGARSFWAGKRNWATVFFDSTQDARTIGRKAGVGVPFLLCRWLQDAKATLDSVAEDTVPHHSGRTKRTHMSKADELACVQRRVTVAGPEPIGAEVYQSATNLNGFRIFEIEHNFATGWRSLSLAPVEHLFFRAFSRPRGSSTHCRLRTVSACGKVSDGRCPETPPLSDDGRRIGREPEESFVVPFLPGS